MDATVLLVMDVQRGVVERFATDPGYLQRLAGAIAAARAAGVPVVYVTVGFRPGHPEISTRNGRSRRSRRPGGSSRAARRPRSTPPWRPARGIWW